jgi:hypothetical protein
MSGMLVACCLELRYKFTAQYLVHFYNLWLKCISLLRAFVHSSLSLR